MKCENEYEIAWWQQGKKKIIGIDEAGRGPIAGPLVVAAVSFPPGFSHEEIYDSKKVSEKKRKLLFREIIALASEYHIAIVEPDVIDSLNIYRATQKTMEDLSMMFQEADGVLTDAMPLPGNPLEVISLVKGDQKSVSIAAASILAKVTRDCIMQAYDKQFPQYGFARHKGYPTKAHIEAMHQYGVIDKIYRKSYGPVAEMNQLVLDI
ncbi:ribonuclease HII [[Eubacterium] hominis]|uniref:ribonuclease HII n=1 Tax=[Eubacterium] hominis TaxID=2764325 RepID=UPI003A4D1D66